MEGCCTGTIARQIDIQLSKLVAKHGDWKLWTANDFHDRVNAHFVPVADKSHLQTVTRALSVAKLDIGPHFDSQEPFTAFSAEVLHILELHREDHLSPEELKTVAYQIYNLIAVESGRDPKTNALIGGPRSIFKKSIRDSFEQDEESFKTFFETPEETLMAISDAVRERVTAQLNFNNIGCGMATTTSTRLSNIEEVVAIPTISNRPKTQTQQLNVLESAKSDPCWGCGKSNTCPKKQQQQCVYKPHPGANKEKKPWKDSTMGRLYASKVPNGTNPPGRDALAANFVPTADKSDVEAIADSAKVTLKAAGVPFFVAGNNKRSHSGGGNTLLKPFDILASYSTDKDASYLRYFTLCRPQDEEGEATNEGVDNNITVAGLVDSGAVHSSYISLAFARRLDKLNILKRIVNKRICTGIKGSQQCSNSSHAYDIELDFINERTLNKEILVIRAQVIDSQFDLIIGQPDIFQFDLAYKFPSLFSKEWSDDQLHNKKHDNDQSIMQALCAISCNGCKHSQEVSNRTQFEPLVENLIVAKEALLDRIEHDWDMIDEPDRPWEEPSETSEGMKTTDVNKVPDESIHGTPAFKERIRTLLDQYEMVFRAQLTAEPAKLPCFELVVDTAKWLATAGGTYPRQMSKDKNKEVERQVRQMLELQLIQPSTVSAASHVMLAPKSGGKWRFCVDYRTLNLLSESLSWPIPNIKHMLERIGSRQARYFGVLDLSQGFYQVPLAAESKALTAFITWCGTYEWNRLPMGIKSAPVYFQFLMATIVLLGLIHVICEIYIDDILIHAQTEDEFCTNLTTILERCKTYNILLNPAKCKFGLPEVEYVGHTINSTGLHFTRSKLDSVLEFELPQVGKQLKSFIGFCNYFRDHVANFSMKMQPLNELLRDYDKRRQTLGMVRRITQSL